MRKATETITGPTVRVAGAMLAALLPALVGCGVAPDDLAGEEASPEATTERTAALVTLPAPYAAITAPATYSSYLDRFYDDGKWISIQITLNGPCPSGLCDITVYRRSRTDLDGSTTTTVVQRILRYPYSNPQSYTQSVVVRGSPDLEYWAVISDGENTSPPSNIVKFRRCGKLYPNEWLFVNSPIYSCQDRPVNRLYPQNDGNLVLTKYETSTNYYTAVVWKTGPKTGANRLYMQADGNLVYSAQPDNVAKWTTKTGSTSSRDNTGSEMWLLGEDLLAVNKVDSNGIPVDLLWRSDIGRTY